MAVQKTINADRRTQWGEFGISYPRTKLGRIFPYSFRDSFGIEIDTYLKRSKRVILLSNCQLRRNNFVVLHGNLF